MTASDGDTFCGECGAALARSSVDNFTPSVPSSPSGLSANLVADRRTVATATGIDFVGVRMAAGVTDLPFVLAHGEQLKAVYPMTKTAAPLGSGSSLIYVTDARVIYRGKSRSILGSGHAIQEIAIADVSGTHFTVSRGMTVLGAAIYAWWALFSLFAAYRLLQDVNAGLAFLLILFVAGIGLWRYFTTRMEFAIQTRQSPGPGISFALGYTSWLRRLMSFIFAPTVWFFSKLGVVDATQIRSVTPLATSRDLAEEIGALVLDLQNRGTLGAE